MTSHTPSVTPNRLYQIRQADESNGGLVAIAAVLIVLHLAVALVAAAQRPWRTGTTSTPHAAPTT